MSNEEHTRSNAHAVDLGAVFGHYTKQVDAIIRKLLTGAPDYPLYGMMRYFMGYADQKLHTVQMGTGKRFRSGLCVFIADSYGCRNEALPVAASLEIFHNFTLIHDDIVDKDEFRRGRPTVWKLWGIDHAINTGDGQLILALRALKEIHTRTPGHAPNLLDFLTKRYLEVIEGQYLDFELTAQPLSGAMVTRGHYFNMVTKKTAVLVAAATAAGGMVAGVPKKEERLLWRYGLSLGLAYQLYDDALSLWGTSAQTGKKRWGDIRTRKKTLPVLMAREQLQGTTKDRLMALFSVSRLLKDREIKEVLALLESVHTFEAMQKLVEKHARAAKKAARQLALAPERREILSGIVDALMPTIDLRLPQHE